MIKIHCCFFILWRLRATKHYILAYQKADYTVSYSNNINAGTVTVTIMERGSYEGTTGTTFQITSRSIREVTVEKIGKSAVFFGGGVVQYFM